MTRFPYDQFAKDYLKELLLPLGEVTPSRKVAGEIREIDVYFAPSPQPQIDKQSLGLLGRFATTQALFEPFQNAVKRSEVRSCMNKLFNVCAQLEREAKSNNTSIEEESLPRLWILSPTASEQPFLHGFMAFKDEENWQAGIDFLGDSLRTFPQFYPLTLPTKLVAATPPIWKEMFQQLSWSFCRKPRAVNTPSNPNIHQGNGITTSASCKFPPTPFLNQMPDG